MRTMTPRASSHVDPPSSKKNFKWIMRRKPSKYKEEEEEEEEDSTTTNMLPSSSPPAATVSAKKRSSASVAISRFRSAVTAALIASSRHSRSGNGSLGFRITGTLYGHRRGHVHLAFQVETKSCPVVLLELATLTSNLVREMASGLVRIALECERKNTDTKTKSKTTTPDRLLTEEPMWRAYCNGRKCGYAVRRECGPSDWKVLRAVEPVSMGAGVLPKEAEGEGEGEGEVMYMRAKFERVVGSRDSEAFYMMNPDGNGGTELSVYFLRV